MTMAADASALLTIWGTTHSIMSRAVSFSDTGDPTPTWTESSTPLCYIQPVSGDTIRQEQGQQIVTTHEGYLPNGTVINEGNRIRPPGWVAGDDEYQVRLVEAWAPSHVRVRLVLVEGHGG